MPAARLVCQRPSSNFSYFRTPLANFLLFRSNSVEYGNCKTTTLLPSAKCMRPFFQGRTGCGGRPSGWHDIVTCQRLVYCCCATINMVNKDLRKLVRRHRESEIGHFNQPINVVIVLRPEKVTTTGVGRSLVLRV